MYKHLPIIEKSVLFLLTDITFTAMYVLLSLWSILLTVP